MVKVIEIIMDIFLHILKGCLMIYLFRSLVSVKSKFVKQRHVAEAVIILQYTLFYIALSYVKPFRSLFYGDADAPYTSRLSIIPLAVSMGLTLCVCLYFYGGEKSKLVYLIFTYYTINELITFTLHTLFVAILEGVIGLWNPLIMAGDYWVIQNFHMILTIIQFIWNLAFQIVFIVLLYITVRYLKRNLSIENRELTHVQQLFLAVPCIMGMCFSIMMRSILYKRSDIQIEFLVDDYPETNVLIPVISLLCLTLIVLSTIVLRKLIESNEKEVLVEIYQNRISDMEEHMKDVEHLYDGIRGMRHDMKNYVADLEILLQGKTANENPAAYQNEIRHYLDGICSALEELEMKCNTGNPVTDVVISRKIRIIGERGIKFDCNFIYPDKLEIGVFDISIILNNGLDNAIEAAEKEEAPYIYLDSYVRENMFFIEIRNSFTGSLCLDETGKNLLTCKEEAGHGLGFKNIKNCAARYNGRAEWAVQEKEFILTVMLQGKS